MRPILGALAGILCAVSAAWPAPGLAAPAAPASAQKDVDTETDASAYTPIGKALSNPELPALDGTRRKAIQPGKVAILFFFRPDKDYSKLNLKGMADCDARFAGKAIQVTGIVPERFGADVTKPVVAEAGAKFAILFDTGDALYTEVGVAQHPAAAIVDRDGKLAEYQPFTKLNFCELVEIRARHVLGEVSEAEMQAVVNPQAGVFQGDASASSRHVKMAEMFLSQGKAKEASEQGRLAVEKAPSSAAAHSVLGAALAAAGDCKGAVAEFDAALKADPKDARAADGKKGCAGK